MSSIPTQAQIVRAVKAAITGFQAATGRTATGTKVTFCAGEPIVEVTSSEESAPRPPVKSGGHNVQDLKEALRERHAARRT